MRLVGTQLYLQPGDTTAVGPSPADWQLQPALPHRLLLPNTCYQITGPHSGSPTTKYQSFCSEEHPCSVGQGDCRWSLDCLTGLRCGTGNCNRYGSEPSLDCCEHPGGNNHTEVSGQPRTDWYSAFSTCSDAGGILAEIGDLFIQEVHGLEPNYYYLYLISNIVNCLVKTVQSFLIFQVYDMVGVRGGDWWVGLNTLGPAPDRDHLCAVARQDGVTERNCRMNGGTQTSVLCKFGNINNKYGSVQELRSTFRHLKSFTSELLRFFKPFESHVIQVSSQV